LFPSNIISLAKRTGASVLPIFVIRDRIKHKIVIEPAIEINSKSNEDAFEEFVKILEKYIRQYPSLWEFWEEFEEGVLIVPDK
jgi:lauroyl/myristoyl acyltransferase